MGTCGQAVSEGGKSQGSSVYELSFEGDRSARLEKELEQCKALLQNERERVKKLLAENRRLENLIE
jgi:hypothetical protein